MTRNRYTHVRHRFAAIAAAVALTVTGSVVGAQAATAAPISAAAVSAPAPNAAQKVMVTTADLNLRTSPSTSARIITTLKKGTKVTVTGSSGSWRKVVVGNRTGWVSGKYLADLPAKTALKVTKIVPTSGSTVVSGKQVTVSGTASKNLRGKKLKTQVKVGGAWRTLSATPKVSTKGTFTLTTKATGIGKTAYRVVFTATTKGTRLAGSSASRTVTVWKWIPLASQRIVDYQASHGWHEPNPEVVSMAGVTYKDGIVGKAYKNRENWSEFNTSFQCKTFTALAGADDSTASDATGTSFVSVDGEQVGSTVVNLTLGKPTRITADLTDSMRLRLTVFGTNGTSLAGWGDVRILCKKDVNPLD
jgi:uncharacterized protein YraI